MNVYNISNRAHMIYRLITDDYYDNLTDDDFTEGMLHNFQDYWPERIAKEREYGKINDLDEAYLSKYFGKLYRRLLDTFPNEAF